MSTFSKHELYGGAITVDLPKDYIDASDLRQIPSHQELFLSPTSLTSVIIEINARLPDPDSSAPRTHFTDPIEAPDTASITSTTQVNMARAGLSAAPAYVVSGTITSHERLQRDDPQPVAWEIKSLLLLVRLESKGTDLCVRVNVPTKEFGKEQIAREEAVAREMVDRIVATLEITDWSLFVD